MIAQCGLLLVFDLAHRLILTLALLTAAFLCLPFAVRRLAALPAPGRAILLGAVLLRLPLLPLPPMLSDDVPRYLWDGKVAAAGFNPYALAPADPDLAALRGGQRVPHDEVPTVYPPLAIAAFSIASRLPFPMLAWKALAAGADLGACALLLALARRLGAAEARTAWYAWNPLPALEVAGMGHVDALGVAAVLATVLVLVGRSKPSTGGEAGRAPSAGAALLGRWVAPVCAAAGALVKLVPVVAFPLWGRASRRPGWFLTVALGLSAAAVLPVVAATGGVPPGLLVYGVSWEFDGPVFEPLWRLLDAAGTASWIAARLAANEVASGDFYRWDAVYPYLYPQLLAKVLLGLGAAAAVALSLREREVAAGTGRLFGRLLLLSATVYPWYLLWVLPWAALGGRTAWLALSGLILLSYLPQHAGLPLMPWIYLAIWGPFAALVVVDWWRRRSHP